MRIRFQLDEHIANAVAYALRRRSIEVWTAHEASVRGLADPEVLAFCTRERCVLVTDDAHFLGLHAESERHAGIVYCPRGSRSLSHVIQPLVLIHGAIELEEMTGRIEFT